MRLSFFPRTTSGLLLVIVPARVCAAPCVYDEQIQTLISTIPPFTKLSIRCLSEHLLYYTGPQRALAVLASLRVALIRHCMFMLHTNPGHTNPHASALHLYTACSRHEALTCHWTCKHEAQTLWLHM
eukprot:1136712-Pelagomonas_calceolata.AAC.4